MTTYDVVLLIEQPLSELDAQQVISLHEAIEDPVVYHVMLPALDAAAAVEAGMESLGLANGTVTSANWQSLEQMHADEQAQAQRDIDASEALFASLGKQATTTLIDRDPVAALVEKVAEVQAGEVIVMTRPHVVSEFFHVDWSSRARRKLNVPVLHLIEHETFDEQSIGIQ